MKKTVFFSLLCLSINSLLNAQNRIVLIEQFTNSGCPPCAASTPPVFDYVNMHPEDVVSVSYHTSYPYKDSLHLENPGEVNQRVSYYGSFGVPYSIVDGNQYANASSYFLSVMPKTINDRKAIEPKYKIESHNLYLSGNQLKGSFHFTSMNASNENENLVANLVVIEKNVLKSSYVGSPGANSENEYGYVMRKMIPGANGTVLENKKLSENDHIEFSWVLNKIKNNDEIRVVAFVQNKDTKEIYQSQIFDLESSPTTGIDVQNTTSFIRVFPNPSSSEINIQLNSEQYVNTIKITNQLGETVYTETIQNNTNLIRSNPGLKNGVYYITISSDSNSWTEKVLIIK